MTLRECQVRNRATALQTKRNQGEEQMNKKVKALWRSLALVMLHQKEKASSQLSYCSAGNHNLCNVGKHFFILDYFLICLFFI